MICQVYEVSTEQCERRGYHVLTIGGQEFRLCGEHARKAYQGAYDTLRAAGVIE